MLFKLSLKNMKKSFKDYAIYFLTLVLGIAIFYMFNSLDSQQAMLDISNSQREMIKLMIEMLNFVSVFVAVILGLLIVYANNFLINRRKKEFGIYMTLGMGKRQISKIILLETILVGIISLGIGLIIGVFASQLMSILVGKLFEADMSKFEFVFSTDSCIKTCAYFAIMYIAVMLFMTISILSSSLSLRNTMQKDLKEMTPVDINLYKTANLPEKVTEYGTEVVYTKEQKEDSRKPISETLINNGYDMNNLKDIVEIELYGTKEWKIKDSLGTYYETAKSQFPFLMYDATEPIVKVSDYNKIAKLYGNEEYSLNDDEYIVLCDFDNMKDLRNNALRMNDNSKITINGKEYHSKYNECKTGFIAMSTSHTNTGIILVPDSFDLKEEWKDQHFLAANYNAETEEEKEKIEPILVDTDSDVVKSINDNDIELEGLTKIAIIQASVGIATIVVFISIYLGIIFLIASAAILALKQLTESSDNRQRYIILRKIGCDEKMINKALFRQIAIFFMLPLVFAIIHSIFGIQFVLSMMAGLASAKELLPSIIATVIIIGVIYGLYFLATYLGSKNIIKED